MGEHENTGVYMGVHENTGFTEEYKFYMGVHKNTARAYPGFQKGGWMADPPSWKLPTRPWERGCHQT